MLTFRSKPIASRMCDGLSRRDFLRVGTFGLGGLTLADLLRLKARGAIRPARLQKAVIMVYLPGGPSHIDMYDMKPDAPAEIRGAFKPIRTNVPGLDICELMPLQAKIADKLAIVRGLKTQGNHDPTELLTGIPAAGSGQIGPKRRPALGCVVSKLCGTAGPIPPYVSLSDHRLLPSYDDPEEPAYLGAAHRPFAVKGQIMKDLTPLPEISSERLEDRKALLRSFDTLQRDIDMSEQRLAGMDTYQARALEMIVSPRVRDALDLNREADKVRDTYGLAGADFLRARRLVEAGVSVVSIAAPFSVRVPGTSDPGWDNHASLFKVFPTKLPIYDRAVHALITDLHARGLDRDVAVAVWGEFGREPRITVDRGACETHKFCDPGRGHWPEAGFALLAGGGLKTGLVVGETDAHGARAKGRPYTAQHVLATLYHVLGIDPGATTLNDHNDRPQYLLDSPEKISALV